MILYIAFVRSRSENGKQNLRFDISHLSDSVDNFSMSTQDDGLSSKNWVWVPDEMNFFLKGYVTDYLDDGKCKVNVIEGNQESTRIVDGKMLENCNPTKFNKCDDMAELTHLNEPSVVYNLYLRYNDDLIYTYSGLFLVAINPYKNLPVYGLKFLRKYHSKDQDKPPPHIYAIAEGTYRNLLQNSKDQSILVTGESGAGKTENTKYIIQYLSSITFGDSSVSENDAIDAKILQANPILESFGNAKTIKNNNSSRFGKFIRIFFTHSGQICGANIDYYLLEKSRVVNQANGEKNYHIFYQLLKGQDGAKLEEYGLKADIREYKYLSDASARGSESSNDFNMLLLSFKTMGFEDTEVDNIFSILASILHLGNIEFKSWKSEQASFTDDSPVEIITSMLGLQRDKFIENLLRPKVKAGREYVHKSRKAPEVKYAVDALAKFLYEKIFQYIVRRINDNLKGDNLKELLNFIGVLDIAGFEIFQKNSFEQLCINYTNEKLQQFFNHHSFILEQSEYLREDIQWEFIDFGQDLQPTIDLIESRKPLGILELLNEECKLPKSSDESFMEKLAFNWEKSLNNKFRLDKLKRGFIIDHYAGPVQYDVSQWLQKNTDPVNEQLISSLVDSSRNFVKDLFAVESLVAKADIGRSPRLRTASQKHKDQLNQLMDQLSSTEPHFVRCILPNLEKKPNRLDKKLVLAQLRCNGVLEGIRITRAGYPNRMTFDDFCLRYLILSNEIFTKNIRTNSEMILRKSGLEPDGYKVGITKIFFKNGVLGKLEALRDLCLKSIFTELQGIIRANAARKDIKSKINKIQSAQLIASTFRALDKACTSNPWFDLFINVKPLLEDSLKILDSKELSKDLRDATERLKDAEKLNQKVEADNGALRRKIEAMENQLILLTSDLKAKETLVESLHVKEKENLESLSNSAKSIELALTQNDVLTKSIKSLEEKDAKNNELLAEVRGKVDSLKKDYELSVQKIKDFEAQLSSADTLKQDLERQVREKELEYEEKMESVRHENKHLSELHDSLQQQLSQDGSARNDLDAKISILEGQYESAKETIRELESENEEKKVTIRSLQSRIEEIETSMCSLQDKYSNELQNSKNLCAKLVKAEKETELFKSSKKQLEEQAEKLKREILTMESREMELKGLLEKQTSNVAETQELKKEVRRIETERDKTLESLNILKIEFGAVDSSKNEYSKIIVELKSRVEDLESKLKFKEREKENFPPLDQSFKNEYSNMKLKFNEQSAQLRQEKFENKKLCEELNILRSRRSPEKLNNLASSNRRSLAIGEDLYLKSNLQILNKEIESLKFKLEQEESNAQRAENYAVQLQKKLNKLQATRGLETSVDYEAKFRESQNKISELEQKFGDYLKQGETTLNLDARLSKSESLDTISHLALGKNQDFVRIYQDITATLKTTRGELATAKSEILRLKHLLRESEDELYNVKRLTFKHSAIDFESDLAHLKVQNDGLISRNNELSKDLDVFKKRSESYFQKLELAESAVKISKRHEDSAKKELNEIKGQLILAREEARASQIMIKEINSRKYELESALNESSFEKLKLKNKILELQEKIDYFGRNYSNKEVNEKYKEEIRSLHRDLNFKMQTETSLIKENKKYKLEYEDLLSEKNELEKGYESLSDRSIALESKVTNLTEDVRVLNDEKTINERKINSSMKQIKHLKELIDEINLEKDRILEKNASLSDEVSGLKGELDEHTQTIHQYENDTDLLRKHLETQREIVTELRTELESHRTSSSTSVENYQKVKREQLLITEENDSLKKVNKELVSKVLSLEEKLYSNEQLRYWENKVSKLGFDLENSRSENFNLEKKMKDLEREVQNHKIKADNDMRLIKKYNDENFEFKNKANQFKSSIDVLHNEILDKDIRLKYLERENEQLKESVLQLEKEMLRKS